MEKLYFEEKERLEYVIKYINKKIIEAQKKFDSQKNFRIGFSEGKKGTQFIRQAFMSMYAIDENKLKSMLDSPYFARMDFKTNEGLNEIYIGKKGLVGDNLENIIYDWRSNIASMYYDCSLGHAEYNNNEYIVKGEILKKRQINIEKGKLISVDEQDTLTNDKILLKYLSDCSDARLKSIVATIQKEQNSIIRSSLKKDYIIQGVAGSGKTTVALHRIAYLLYNETKNINESDFMILGPNNYFLNYISGLLPDLDITNVSESTFDSIALNNIGKVKLENQNKTLENILLENVDKNTISYKFSLEFLKLVSDFIEFYIISNINNNIVYEGIEMCNKEKIKSLLDLKSKNKLKITYGKKINIAKKYISNKIKENSEELCNEIWLKYRDEYLLLDKDNPRRKEILDITDEINKELKKGCVKVINEYFKFINISPINLYIAFINSIDEKMLNNKNIDLETLKKYTLERLNNKKVGREDLAPLILIKYLISGIEDYKEYEHIVIDEGQDLSISEYYILKLLFPNAKFDIYGDLNQSIYSYQGINDWEELNEVIFDFKCNIIKLNKGYRTTEQICHTSNYILDILNKEKSDTVARSGEEIHIGEKLNEFDILNIIHNYLNKGYKTIAIICKDSKETDIVYKKLNELGLNIHKISDKDLTYDGGICIMPSYLSKGLEFDAVILYDVSEIKYNSSSEIDMKLLYVSITRGLHELYINYNDELTKPLTNLVKDKVKILRK